MASFPLAKEMAIGARIQLRALLMDTNATDEFQIEALKALLDLYAGRIETLEARADTVQPWHRKTVVAELQMAITAHQRIAARLHTAAITA